MIVLLMSDVLCPCYVLHVNVTCDVPCPCYMLHVLQNRNPLEIIYFTETGPFYIVTLLLLILSCIINKKKRKKRKKDLLKLLKLINYKLEHNDIDIGIQNTFNANYI